MGVSVTIAGTKPTADGGQETFTPLPYINSNLVPKVDYPTLASGDNSFTPPPNCGAVGIYLPLGNTALVKVRTINGDTGISLAKTGWSWITLDPSVTTLYLNAAAEIIAVELWWA